VIGTVAREHRREFECVPARNAGAGDNRHGSEILRDRRVHTGSMANPTPPGPEGETFYGQPIVGRPVGQVFGVRRRATVLGRESDAGATTSREE
jgi:hypothetical protein